MKILIVGGTGLIGGHCAIHLQSLGHEVTVAARKPPAAATPMASMHNVQFDYAGDDLPQDLLAAFDAVVFAAGNDIRHIAPGEDPARRDYWDRVNSEAIPRFARRARRAGVARFIYVGSFYPQVAPQLVEENAYVRSRHLADTGVRELSTDTFLSCSINAPFVVGTLPGLQSPLFEAFTAYAQGHMNDLPVFAPAGGSNFMSSRSLAEAVAGALAHGEPATAYLVGDENLSFAEYLGLFFAAAGNAQTVPARDEEHALLPDIAILTGRGSVVSYQPEPAQTRRLGYRRSDVQAAVRDVVQQFRR
ncbi:MAG: nucleoside-diphosphate sugar epimerase [Halioglobus sp.]|nr:nucleoside-diphosphate sugar epimerase [Halioglobus sp.]|tara:strand:+ start:2215 stop:3126 length:912 start_codon:yes stop_codon:yes gene_type:complete